LQTIIDEIEKMINEKGIQIRTYGLFNRSDTNLTLVSVIVRSYNGERFILDALNSILETHWRPIEIIILYDRSMTDMTRIKIAKFIEEHKQDEDLMIKLIVHDRMSAFRSLLVGLKNVESSSKYICFLDYDNIFYPNKIKEQVEFMKRNNLPFSFSNQYIIDENGKILGLFLPKPPKIDLKKEIESNFIDTNTICISSEFLSSLLKYLNALQDETFDWIAEDYLIGILSLALLKRKDVFIDLPLTGYRVHSKNTTSLPPILLNKLRRKILTYLSFLYILEKYPEDFKSIKIKKRFYYVILYTIESSNLKTNEFLWGFSSLSQNIIFALKRIFRKIKFKRILKI